MIAFISSAVMREYSGAALHVGQSFPACTFSIRAVAKRQRDDSFRFPGKLWVCGLEGHRNFSSYYDVPRGEWSFGSALSKHLRATASLAFFVLPPQPHSLL
jgi:hypothetical protein